MISTISLHNFQAHKKSTLSLSPGVNAIVGQSDCGKTSILRAIRWVVENQPSGDAFRSHWGGNTEVELDGVWRVRTKSQNGYIHGEQEYVALGVGKVPVEISAHLGLDAQINLQAQHDAPFLLFDSPGDVSRCLNQCANLEIIDGALAKINSMTRECAADLKAAQGEQERIAGRLEAYKGLDELAGEAESLRILSATVSTNQSKTLSLSALLTKIEKAQAEQKRLVGVEELKGRLTYLLGVDDNLDADRMKFADLKSLLSRYTKARESLIDREVLEGVQKDRRFLEDALEVTKEKKKQVAALRSIINQVEELERKKYSADHGLVRLENEFHQLMPETCPLCGRSD